HAVAARADLDAVPQDRREHAYLDPLLQQLGRLAERELESVRLEARRQVLRLEQLIGEAAEAGVEAQPALRRLVGVAEFHADAAVAAVRLLEDHHHAQRRQIDRAVQLQPQSADADIDRQAQAAAAPA